jgi:hypothetical protein
MQTEAKRSPRGGSPCNLRFAGSFSEKQGEPILLPAKFPNSFKILERLLPDLRSREHFLVLQGRSREHFWYCREKSSVELRMVTGLARGLKAFAIEYRGAEDQTGPLPALAAELVRHELRSSLLLVRPRRSPRWQPRRSPIVFNPRLSGRGWGGPWAAPPRSILRIPAVRELG